MPILSLFPVDENSVDELGVLFLSASQDQNIHLWRYLKNSQSADDSDDVIGDRGNADSVTLLHQFKGHARSVDTLAVSPDKQEVHKHASTCLLHVVHVSLPNAVLFCILGHVLEDLVCRYEPCNI